MWAAGALASFAFATASPALCAAPNPCSLETFTVDGAALTIRVCDLAQPQGAAPRGKQSAAASSGELQETLSVDGRPPIVRSIRYERTAYDETTHALDDVPLQTLGIARTLHVVLAVRGGSARLEHALLVPGAISLK